MDLFDLVAKITLDSTEYEKGIINSQESAKSWGNGIKSAAKVGATAIAAVSAAVVAVGAGLTKSVKSVAEYGDKVDKMSQKIGISSDSYQKWDYVMQRAGTSVDNLKMGMKTLSKQAESNSDAFQKLGISQEEVSSLSQEELFERTVKGLADMEAGTERTALATELLGRAGADLGPLLNEGSDAIEEQMEIAEKYGMVMPEETVKASAAFRDSVTTMQMTMTGFKNRALGEFLPSFTKVTDGLALLFTGDMSGIEDIEEGLDGIMETIDEVLPTLMDVGGEIIEHIAMSIVENLPKIATSAVGILMKIVESIINNLPIIVQSAATMLVALAEGLSENLPTLIPAVVEAVITIVTTLVENVPMLIDAASKLIIGLATGLIKSIPVLVKKVPTIIKSLVSAIIKSNVKLLSAGISLMGKLASGIIKGFASIPSKVISLAGKIPTAIKNGVGNLFSIGSDMIEGLWNGIKGKWDSMVSKLKTAAANLPKAVKKVLGIGSPSKVFAEVGRWIPEGLALGIEKNMGVVYDASDAMADATMFTPSDGVLAMGMKNSSFNADDMGNVIGDRIADALDGMDIVLDRRSFGKMTRKAVGAI